MVDEVIAAKATAQPQFTQLQTTPFVRPKLGERGCFEVNVAARAGARQRKEATVACSIPGYSAFTLQADEGTSYYGDDAAPPPLAYFAAGAAFCLLTHLQALVHARRLDVRDMRIEQRMQFSTTLATTMQHGGAPDGRCDGIETHVLIDSDEPAARIAELVREAEVACMAHQTILNPTPGSVRVVVNGAEAESRPASARR